MAHACGWTRCKIQAIWAVSALKTELDVTPHLDGWLAVSVLLVDACASEASALTQLLGPHRCCDQGVLAEDYLPCLEAERNGESITPFLRRVLVPNGWSSEVISRTATGWLLRFQLPDSGLSACLLDRLRLAHFATFAEQLCDLRHLLVEHERFCISRVLSAMPPCHG